MKKVMMVAVMVAGMTSYGIAQDAPTPPAQSEKGQAVRAVAQAPETGKEKGQLVSETASETGKQKSAEAKAKAQTEEEINTPDITKEPNHGSDVKAVAADETLTGREKGEAVKAVATTNPKAKRSERPKRERAVRPERPTRPERAKRPATAGRPSVPGRP
jgi:hypothetical protein